MREFANLDEVRAAVGEKLGTSDWHTVTQEQIDLFADATEDHQWIHVDLERAKAGPFGGPIAHGYLTLSMMPKISSQLWKVDGLKMGVNYGLNKVRFPSPVPVGSRIRGHGELTEVSAVAVGLQATLVVTVEIEGQDKPACVAECLVRLIA
jgi:acyl dehydratase